MFNSFVNQCTILFFFLIVFTFGWNENVSAQFNFEFNGSIPVYDGNSPREFPWAGGLNYAQFSDIDVDFDGDLDLFVFDRSSDNIRVFLNEQENGNSVYRFLYGGHNLFPSDIRYRATAVDYNNDGRKDLFVYGIGGIKVYRNTGDLTNGLQWVVAKNLLYSNNWGVSLNLYVSSADIPAIVDVEGDGDYDILTFHIGGEHLQYHQNQSMELYGVPDSLEFELKNECWGKFREDISTSTVYLNDQTSVCTSGNVPNAESPTLTDPFKNKPTEQQPKHAGSTVLALDMNNNGVMDLVLGDVAYPNLNLLMNGGTSPNSNSAMISVDNAFPSNSQPANLFLFPAAFYVDTDFDGKKDLVVGANAKNISQNEASIIQYKNVGTNNAPLFVYQTNAFLQQDMVEHGTGSIPVFYDFDEDGLEDLFVANFYRYKPTLDKESGISYYKNTGTATNPQFTFIDNDLLNLSSASLGLHLVPTFGDLNGDNHKDLLIGLENGTLQLYTNNGNPPTVGFTLASPTLTDVNGNTISSGQYATPQLFDLSGDGLLDLVLGRKTGELMYYENVGTSSNALFELKNDTLGNIDIATTSPDGFPVPHFFKWKDTTYLFLGGADGFLRVYKNIEGHLSSDSSFTLLSDQFLNIQTGAYSSFWVNDLDKDSLLELFVGQDLGGLWHLEVDPSSTASIEEPVLNLWNIAMYPNPTFGTVALQDSEGRRFTYHLRDAMGRTIIPIGTFSSHHVVDLSLMPNGVYFICCSDEFGAQKTMKLLKR
jgi:hypothetical protein